jgi:hypothetical protein
MVSILTPVLLDSSPIVMVADRDFVFRVVIISALHL